MSDILVRCTRCRYKHMESERICVARKSDHGLMEMCCPRCGCRSYYDMRPQVAWCWASGLIEMGDSMPVGSTNGSGAIQIASGPKTFLVTQINARARHGKGDGNGQLLVPGVPEANTQRAKGDALAEWLRWCGRCSRGRHDRVEWSKEVGVSA